MLLATLRARVYCTGLSLWLLSVGNLYPTQAQALKLNPFQPGIQLAPHIPNDTNILHCPHINTEANSKP